MNKISPKRPMPPKDDKVEDAFVTEEQRQEYYRSGQAGGEAGETESAAEGSF